VKIHVLTIFPEIFSGFLSESIIKIAQEKSLLEIVLSDFREFAADKHRSVDDSPYGGGPGMLLMPDPVVKSAEAILEQCAQRPRIILLTPQGRRLDQKLARELSRENHLLLICGRYEGFDARIAKILQVEEISIGDYVLSGGEVPAMAVIEAVARLIPGVVGDPESPITESFTENRLEYPQYTRPADYRGEKVPDVLLSGNHAEIKKWREKQSLKRTREKRPDLFDV